VRTHEKDNALAKIPGLNGISSVKSATFLTVKRVVLSMEVCCAECVQGPQLYVGPSDMGFEMREREGNNGAHVGEKLSLYY
jgi:hypothetical protein